MLQAVMVEPGRIEYREVEKPAPRKGEIVIAVKRIGVCGSDMHVFHGLHPYTTYPVVQGHEVSGEVESVGAGVKGFSPGDKVIFMPQVTCTTCYSCIHGMYHICDSLKVMGFQTGGAAQEYFPVAADMALKLPDGISLDEGAMIEPVAVAVHALRRGGDVRDKKVLVLGSGPIGNLTGQVAKGLGAKAVMITDINDFRLEMARKCKLDFTVNTQVEDLSEAILRDFGPDRADLILECVGAEQTISQAIALARKGSTIVIVGVFGKKPVVDIGLVQDRELNLIGTLMYQRKDYEKAIELAASGKLHLDVLITDRFPFTSYLEAYKHIEEKKGQTLKVMIWLD